MNIPRKKTLGDRLRNVLFTGMVFSAGYIAATNQNYIQNEFNAIREAATKTFETFSKHYSEAKLTDNYSSIETFVEKEQPILDARNQNDKILVEYFGLNVNIYSDFKGLKDKNFLNSIERNLSQRLNTNYEIKFNFVDKNDTSHLIEKNNTLRIDYIDFDSLNKNFIAEIGGDSLVDFIEEKANGKNKVYEKKVLDFLSTYKTTGISLQRKRKGYVFHNEKLDSSKFAYQLENLMNQTSDDTLLVVADYVNSITLPVSEVKEVAKVNSQPISNANLDVFNADLSIDDITSLVSKNSVNNKEHKKKVSTEKPVSNTAKEILDSPFDIRGDNLESKVASVVAPEKKTVRSLCQSKDTDNPDLHLSIYVQNIPNFIVSDAYYSNDESIMIPIIKTMADTFSPIADITCATYPLNGAIDRSQLSRNHIAVVFSNPDLIPEAGEAEAGGVTFPSEHISFVFPFPDDENFSKQQVINRYRLVATHELGHALSLEHTPMAHHSYKKNLMQPTHDLVDQVYFAVKLWPAQMEQAKMFLEGAPGMLFSELSPEKRREKIRADTRERIMLGRRNF